MRAFGTASVWPGRAQLWTPLGLAGFAARAFLGKDCTPDSVQRQDLPPRVAKSGF